jgi:hypothetical protein
MNESGFIRKIHRRLPREVYAWKIADRYHGGIPDAYYSGSTTDLWVEYKYAKSAPKTLLLQTLLTALQRKWLIERDKQGRTVRIVFADPKHVWVFTPQMIDQRISLAENAAYTHNEYAEWLTAFTSHGPQGRTHNAANFEK